MINRGQPTADGDKEKQLRFGAAAGAGVGVRVEEAAGATEYTASGKVRATNTELLDNMFLNHLICNVS